MTTIYHPAHLHFQVHKDFIKGCFASPDNPPIVECRRRVINDKWEATSEPSWDEMFEYHIKPRTITRTVTYPEPLREAPVLGAAVWLVKASQTRLVAEFWHGQEYQLNCLKNGMVFATEADAQACYDAHFGDQE